MTAFGYARKSVTSDDSTMLSPQVQRDRVTALAKAHGDDDIVILEDLDVSGAKVEEGHDYMRLVRAVEDGTALAVHAYDVSRLHGYREEALRFSSLFLSPRSTMSPSAHEAQSGRYRSVEPELPDGCEYEVDHTPWGVAVGSDIELSLRESDDGRHTRRVLRWHSAIKDGERRLSVSLVHQKRSPFTGTWQDAHFDLRHLTAGQEVSLDLDAEQTRKLIEHLDVLRQINERLKGEQASTYRVHRDGEVVVPREFGAIIDQLRGTSDGPEEVARNLALVAPDLADSAGIIHQHRVRSEALIEFGRHLDALDWAERDWQRFFERNDWIFGHGLDYRFLVTEETQALYGGADVTNRGGQEGDFLMATAGDARFSVLVEIKKPDTDLIEGERYRNGAWRVSKDLAGGVAQLQANCQQWFLASRQLPNLGYTDLMVDGAPSPHQSDTTLRWLIDRLRS